ncbi:hypothetical protein DFH09DRAFT_1332873 [Mycena vulgaris]|nr:hypothetical protein DFH09DRAFT_1332873 [Mycena vulgaris]
MTAIANEGERVSLHGGPTGFDAIPWTLLTPDNPPTLFTAKELAHIPIAASPSSHAVFRLVSDGGDQGYPGKLVTEVLVARIEPGDPEHKYRKPSDTPQNEEYDLGSVVFVYRAKLDEGDEKFVTPVNLTQHWGFSLDGSQCEKQGGPEPLSVKRHTLALKSDQIAKRDADSLALGFTPSAGTPHEHSSKLIGERYLAMGYGACLLLPASAGKRVNGGLEGPVEWTMEDLEELLMCIAKGITSEKQAFSRYSERCGARILEEQY